VRDTFLIRILTIDDKNLLHLMLEDIQSGYGAKIILLKDDGIHSIADKKDNKSS
jgi:hypothetical protein